MINVTPNKSEILSAINNLKKSGGIFNPTEFGAEILNSSSKFLDIICSQKFWEISTQKVFFEKEESL